MNNIPANEPAEKGFRPVSPSHPCPVCQKPDWCLIALDGNAAICARIEVGSIKRSGDAGWLHRMKEPTPRPQVMKPKPVKPRDWPASAEHFAKQLTPDDRAWLEQRLGLPDAALDAIPLLGKCGANQLGIITTWPEINAVGTVVERTGPRKPGHDHGGNRDAIEGTDIADTNHRRHAGRRRRTVRQALWSIAGL